MVKLVLRLSPLAKFAALGVAVGVGIGVYGEFGDADWARGTSRLLVIVGVVLYFAARVRMILKQRKR
ncbi:MAG: hypothetical protein ACYTGV_14680 [Planctomycetota bacterium]